MKKSSRYKKEYAQSNTAWKKYSIVILVAFTCGGLTVLGYHFFFKSHPSTVPTVEGYIAPNRTYVAPQSEKTVQKIYDLDQSEERPIVEKILPSQDHSKTLPQSDPVPLKDAPLEDASVPKEPLDLLEEKAQHNPPQSEVKPASLEVSPQSPKNKPSTATAPKSKALPLQRIQVGPVFSTLPQAKALFERLNAKAPEYRFSLQARKVQNETRYRIVTQNPLTPAQIQALTQRVVSLSSPSL